MAFFIGLILSLNLSLLPINMADVVVAEKKQINNYIDLGEYKDLLLITKTEQVETKKNIVQAKFQTNEPSIFIDGLFEKYSQEYKVDKQVLEKIAYCESHFNPQAINGPYLGMFQFMESTWVVNRKRMGLDPDPLFRTNPEEAVRTTAYKISKDGVGAWPVCGR